jgi:Holliday junction resolvase RusA-like endonuclease
MTNITLWVRALGVNSLYRIAQNRLILSQKGRDWKKEVTQQLNDLELKPTKNKLKLSIEVYYTKKINPDVDGCLKCLLDVMQGHVYINDNQIYDLHVIKNIGCEFDCIKINYEEM